MTGPAIPVLEDLRAGELTFSQGGTALYATGELEVVGEHEVAWVDRSGQVTLVDPGRTFLPGDANWGMALSPDQEQLALRMETDLGNNIWIKQLPAGSPSRFTFHEGEDRMPRWTPDGQYVTFVSRRGGDLDLFRRRADNTGEAELLLDYERSLAQGFYSPDGEWLVLRTTGRTGVRGGRDILGLRPGIDTVPVPLVATEADEQGPALSPDSRWLAYVSDETGRDEVYVCPFPDTDRGKWKVSDGGAGQPLWAHSGQELFFISDDHEMVVAEIHTGPPFSVGQQRVLFEVGIPYWGRAAVGSYDIAADDQRFLMSRLAIRTERDAGGSPRIILVQNWFEELKEKLGERQ
jgi:dipeptidyl aminopeptidase/acylaminoacyl peptidase